MAEDDKPSRGEDETAEEAREHEVTPRDVTEKEVEHIEDRSHLRPRVIYEVVRLEGWTDMTRPSVSLFWSGVAAGLSISFSLLAEAILQSALPDATWRPLVVDLGYSVGFVMVVMGRQQLFTETTISVVLPVLADFKPRTLWLAARMWTIVFIANMIGTLAAAIFASFTPAVSEELRGAMLELSRHAMAHGFVEMMFRGISAGFLIAAMVWLIPSAEASELFIVIGMTWLIAAGDFAHIVAGSMEAYMLAFSGQWGALDVLWRFMLPTLIGNVVGGTALFALLSYAQVMQEME